MMNKATKVILENMAESSQQTAKKAVQANLKLEEINSMFRKYYADLGYNGYDMFSSFKQQSSFKAQGYRNKRSFACLLSDGDPTIEEGKIGQLDGKYFQAVERIYNRVVNELPSLKEEATKIFTLMAALPSPLPFNPPSPELLRISIDLLPDTEEAFNNSLRRFVYWIFASCGNNNVYSIAKIASNGNPGTPSIIDYNGVVLNKEKIYFKDRNFSAFKKAQINKFDSLIKNKKFLKAFREGDMITQFKHGVLYFYNDQHRGQPDVWNKERFGFIPNDWHAIAKGVFTQPTKLDKRYSITKLFGQYDHLQKSYSGFQISAKKNRFVYAESNSGNGPLNVALSNIRYNYGKEFPYCFKCSDYVSMQEYLDKWQTENPSIKLEDYEIFTFDVTNYDNTFSRGMMRAYIEGVDMFNEDLATLIAYENGAPGGYIGQYDGLDPRSKRNKLFLDGNPFDISTFNFGVAPSGTGEVTEKAKLPCLCFVLFTVFGEFNETRWSDILKWKDKRFLISNLGDNNFIVAHKSLKAKDKLQRSKNLKIDISENNTFGGIQIKVDCKNNRFEVKPNPVSTLIKILTPERPLGDPMRSSYELGIIERWKMSNAQSDIGLILSIIDEAMYDVFGSSSQLSLCTKRMRYLESTYDEKDQLWKRIANYITSNGSGSISQFFLEIMASQGDKLFYTDLYEKCTPDERRVIDSLFFTVLDEDVSKNIRNFFGIK